MWRSGRSPLGQNIDRLSETKYQLTPEEARVLQRYIDEAERGRLCGYVIGGAVAWGLTRRYKVPEGKLEALDRFMKRISITLSGGLVLSKWRRRRASERCEERLAFLEGSPLQGELIAILQEDHPNSALLKRSLKDRTIQGVTYDVEGNIMLNRLPVDSQSTLANFYELSLWNEAEDSGEAGSSQERAVNEKRRSREALIQQRAVLEPRASAEGTSESLFWAGMVQGAEDTAKSVVEDYPPSSHP